MKKKKKKKKKKNSRIFVTRFLETVGDEKNLHPAATNVFFLINFPEILPFLL